MELTPITRRCAVSWNSNATDHHCIEAVVLWQHGTYVVSNGEINTTPFSADGRSASHPLATLMPAGRS